VNDIIHLINFSLTFFQAGAVALITIAIIVLWSFWDILIFFNSNILIEYYKLKEKYLRIGKWIKLRKKKFKFIILQLMVWFLYSFYRILFMLIFEY